MYKQRAKYKWFISYLLILCIPISLCIALWFNMQILINEERIVEGRFQAENLMLQIEMVAKENEIITKYIENEETLKAACALNVVKSEEDREKLQQLSEVVAQYSVGMEESTLYIYLRRTDMVVTAEGYWDSYEYWKRFYKSNGMSYYEWKNDIRENVKMGYTLYSMLFYDKNEIAHRYLVHATMVQKQSDTRYATVVYQSRQEIGNIDETRKTYFVIYDNEGKLICGSEGFARDMLQELVRGKTDTLMEYGGKKYIINNVISDGRDFRYVVAVEAYDSLSQRFLLGMLIVLGVMCILLCIWLLWRNSSKNYAVIERIINRLRKTQKQNISTDEIGMIDSLIDNLVKENEDKEKLLFKQKNQITTFNMSMLLNGHIQAFESAQEELIESERLLFLSDYFVVIVITLEDYREFLEEDGQAETAKEIELVRFAVRNISSEILGYQGDAVYFLGIEKSVTILLSVAPNHIMSAWEEVVENCKYIQKFLEEQLKIVITVSICSTAEGIEGIQTAYKQALEIAKYKTVFRKKVITPDDIEILENAGYGYTHEREEWLISLLKSADAESAITLIDDILALKDKQKLKDVKRLQHTAYCIAGTLLRFCEESGISETAAMENEFLDTLMGTEDLETMKNLIIEMVEQICTQDVKRSKSLEIAQSVMHYIDNNYTDSNLTVAAIAEQYQIHPTYLSNMFKKETNIGVLEYINKQRINLAAELLLKTNDSVGSISEKVGYINVNSFIRIFKKIMGTTPSKYRSVKKIINIKEG